MEGSKEEVKEEVRSVKQLPLFTKKSTVSKSVSSAVSTVSSTVPSSTVSSIISTVPSTISTVSKSMYDDTVRAFQDKIAQKDSAIEHLYNMYLDACQMVNDVVNVIVKHGSDASNTRDWTQFNRLFLKIQTFI